MDNGGSTAYEKPPGEKPSWDPVVFQQSPYPSDQTLTDLSHLVFDASWNELPHELLTSVKAKIEPLERNHLWESLKKRTNR